mmetsp:Transcript_38010/g.63802  ORF Transcript_38010/g.63802 Transcript_38010/m.63802 type:complete len:378 (-) Transcript_38010:386-1519(-)
MEQNLQIMRKVGARLSSDEGKKAGKFDMVSIRPSCNCSDDSSFLLVATPHPSEAKGDAEEWVEVDEKTYEDEEVDIEHAIHDRGKEDSTSCQENKGERKSRHCQHAQRVHDTWSPFTPPFIIPSYFETPTDPWDDEKNEPEANVGWESNASGLNIEEEEKGDEDKITMGKNCLIPSKTHHDNSDSNKEKKRNEDLHNFQNALFSRNFQIYQIKADKEAAEIIQKKIDEELVINYQANEYCAFGDYSPFNINEYVQNENDVRSELIEKSAESEFSVNLPFHTSDAKGKANMKSNPRIKENRKLTNATIISEEPRPLGDGTDVTNLALSINRDETGYFDEPEIAATEVESMLHETLQHFKNLRETLRHGLDQFKGCVQV